MNSRCRECRVVVDYDNKRVDGLKTYCSDCFENVIRTPPKLARTPLGGATSPSKARSKPLRTNRKPAVPAAVRAAAMRRDGGVCVLCRRGEDELGSRLHAHHVIYKSAGGKDSLENIAMLCFWCHRNLHDTDFKDPKTGIRPLQERLLLYIKRNPTNESKAE